MNCLNILKKIINLQKSREALFFWSGKGVKYMREGYRVGRIIMEDGESAVKIYGEGDAQVVEFVADEKFLVAKGPSADSAFFDLKVGDTVTPIGSAESGFQQIEVVRGGEHTTAFIPVP